MKEFQDLYFAVSSVANNVEATKSPIPLFSFEGLPGAGKTTQIKLVSDALVSKYGKTHYVDLPTQSRFGRVLKTLYKNQENWELIRKEMPWLNPLFISIDLRESINEAAKCGAKCALMSRGIISTYYYNLDAFPDGDFECQWDQMQKFMNVFYVPSLIIFLDISEEEANKRVKLRGRGPLRKMDQIEQMRKDKIFLQRCLARLCYIPVIHVNGEETESEVTKQIVAAIEKFMV